MSYGLDSWSSIAGMGKIYFFFLLYSVQTASGAHLTAYTIVTGRFFHGDKAARA
jgi:hypothetical protein